MNAAWPNAVGCVLTDNEFFVDLAKATTNDASPDGAARWLLSFVCNYLCKRGQSDGPIEAFDFAIPDIEALTYHWPAFRAAAFEYETHGIDVAGQLPQLARYLVERMPTVWDGGHLWEGGVLFEQPPVTKALALADRIDTLVGFFGVGIKPSGSKDPFALRRAALNVLRSIMFPITAPFARAA